jgi:hypothetical protein
MPTRPQERADEEVEAVDALRQGDADKKDGGCGHRDAAARPPLQRRTPEEAAEEARACIAAAFKEVGGGTTNEERL